jgi:nitrogen fixation/metabolism regulation signal transduction histidine kinase
MRLPLKRLSVRVWPVAALILLTLGSVLAMSDAVQNSQRFSDHYIWLLLFNTLVLLLLAALIAVNVFEIVRRGLRREPGARLTLRLAGIFVLLALVPVFVVYVFSIRFLDHGIDSWFNVRVEQALGDALELGRSALDYRMRDYLRQTQHGAETLIGMDAVHLPVTLNTLRSRLQASELTVFGPNGRILSSSSESLAKLVPNLPPPDALRQYADGHVYAGLEPTGGHQLLVRVLVAVPLPADTASVAARPDMLQALYRIPERQSSLAINVQDAYDRYQELSFSRVPLKQSFILTLSVVLMLSALSALWAAFVSARRVLRPIRQLIAAIRRVAGGDLQTKLEAGRRDELGLVARSFNEMTSRLTNAREETERGRRQLERQRGYLQTVLEHLSSGVLTLDRNAVLRTANPAADLILEQPLVPFFGRRLADIGSRGKMLYQLYRGVVHRLDGRQGTWQQELELFGETGPKVLICRGARLPVQHGAGGGYVLVFDDMTALIRAQRDAAWGEVARRLAHEIRNPLTPIQLSAERLRRKLAPRVAQTDAQMLERSTDTIVQQVEAMKQMVSAFSDYARAPAMQPEEVGLNALIEGVLELYGAHPGVQLKFEADPAVGVLYADPGRLRQLLHNLLKNAIEAAEGNPQARVVLSTRAFASQDQRQRFVELSVSDNGPGIPEALLARVFEPYVSEKKGGSGLGLAVVKKIVEEHGGRVWGENSSSGGARFVVCLPLQGRAEATDATEVQ